MSAKFCVQEAVFGWIEEYLQSDAPRKRRAAVRSLGELAKSGSERALTMLRELLESSSPDIKEAVRQEIGRLYLLDPAILKRLGDDILVVGRQVLGPTIHTGTDAWFQFLSDPRLDVCAIATLHIICSGNAQDANDAMALLEENLAMSTGELARQILSALTFERFKEQISNEYLEKLLEIVLPRVFDYVSFSHVANLAVSRGLVSIAQSLAANPNPKARLALVHMSGRFPNQQERDMLLGLLNDPTYLVAAAAAKSLLLYYKEEDFSKDVIDRITQILLKEIEVRDYEDMAAPVEMLVQAAKSMARAMPEDIIQSTIADFAESPCPLKRIKAVAMAAARREWLFLKVLASDAHVGVRRAVAYAMPITSPKTKAATEILFGLLKDKDPGVRRQAYEAMSKLGVSQKVLRALEPLVFSHQSAWTQEVMQL